MFAVDQSREMIRLLDKKFGDDPNFTARLGEAENLPFADNQVDYVFANMYLHHVENPPAAIREMLRVLKPGGKLIITDLDAHDFEFLVHEQHDRWMGFKRVDIERWFRDAGLQNVGVDCLDENCCSESKSSNQQAEVSIFVATGSKLSKPPHNFSGDNHRQQLKNFVKQKYGEIADISDCGCGSSNESQDCFTERSYGC